jgi:hypothetical protein
MLEITRKLLTNTSGRQLNNRWQLPSLNIAAIIGIVAPFIYVVLIIVVHLLNPAAGWIQCTLSELALMQYGWLETVATCVFALAILSVSYGLYFSSLLKKNKISLLTVFFSLALALCLVAAFHVRNDNLINPSVIVHRGAVVIASIAFPLACLLLGYFFRSDSRWRNLARYCIAAAVISLVFDLVAVYISTVIKINIAGLWEKASLLNGVLFCQLCSIRLLLNIKGMVIKPAAETLLTNNIP